MEKPADRSHMRGMVFDLAKALAKKGEAETARLLDFEFRQRARAWRLVAEKIGADPEYIAALVARMHDEAIIAELARRCPDRADALPSLYRDSSAAVRQTLIDEIGDPSPYRLL